MVKNIIEKTIREHDLIHEGEHIVIGLSGGPDSVCLFFVLKELSVEMGFHLHAVHVNHGFRPGDAEEDQAYVEQLCQREGIPCRVFSYDCNKMAQEMGLSSEEAGRRARYEAFYKVASELPVTKEKIRIAVAQNENDQAETVLLRILRGTGTDGLAGMDYSRKEKDICVIRPLLDARRTDIEAYCREHNLLPRTDHTNLQPVYTRNKVRLQLLPQIEEQFNPKIMDALIRLSTIAREDQQYLWEQAENAYAEIQISEGVLSQEGLQKLSPAIRHRVMMKAFEEQGLTQDISQTHLEAADSVLGNTDGARIVEFPGGYQMVVRYGEVIFGKKASEPEKLRLTIKVTEEPEKPGADSAVFDYQKITDVYGESFQVELRTRRAGDYLPMEKGRKKLQNLLVDEKVPKDVRDFVQFAAIGSEILWLMEQPHLSIKKSRYNPRYKLDEETKKRLILERNCDI